MILPPDAARLFARLNFHSSANVMTMIKALAIMQAYMPGLYPVASSCFRNTVEPMMPPMPPVPTRVAEHRARFHCPAHFVSPL